MRNYLYNNDIPIVGAQEPVPDDRMEIVTEERTYEGLHAVPAIVMAVLESTGIREMIDERCKAVDEADRAMSPGMVVKAMVGAMVERGKRPLYRISDYYSSAPVDKLFGERVTHDSLSDTVLANRLDVLFGSDLRQLLLDAYLLLKEKYGFDSGNLFLDGSNYTMYGRKYAATQLEHDLTLAKRGIEVKASPMPSYGGNQKDGRKDLVQMNISHVVDSNGIPVCSKSYDGNTSDITMNKDMIEYLRGSFDMGSTILMADCKLCVEDILTSLYDSGIAFVTKVPLNFNEKLRERVLDSVMGSTMERSRFRPGRSYYETLDTVDGRKMRVIAYTLPHSVEKSEKFIRGQGLKSAAKSLTSLKGKRFFCEDDAKDAFVQTMANLSADCYSADLEIVYDKVAEKKYKDGKHYRAVGRNLRIDEDRFGRAVNLHAIQALITNLPFSDVPSADRRRSANSDDVVDLYLEQYKAEAGFKMMKSGMDIADVYIHTPSRITAVAFVVSLATMVCKTLDGMHPGLKDPGEPKRTVKTFADIHTNTLLKYDRRHDRLSVMGHPGATGEIFHYIEKMGIDPQLLLGY